MTPEQRQALEQHVQAIAEILYADADKSQMSDLGGIERVRNVNYIGRKGSLKFWLFCNDY